MSTSTPRSASTPTTPPRRQRLLAVLSREATGGFLLIAAAAVALAWANSAWGDGYLRLSETVVGPAALNLDLSLSTWAADGALAIFFFVVGLELKHELRVGALRDPRAAAVPVIAAVGGMVVPALVFAGVVLVSGERGLLSGWAIPTATDIAFALAVLAIFGRGLPSALRIFLLTLAVVDDLLAVTIIALFYTDDLDLLWLGVAMAFVAAFAMAARAGTARVWVLLPLSLVAWGAMHESGVHATIAGVLLGLVVPATARHGEHDSRVHWLEGINRPLSSAIALPFFAFFAAGVPVDDLGAALTEPLAVAIVLALIGGKVVGVVGGAALASRLPGLRLDGGLTVGDLLPVSLLAAIGFTVSLLIAELSFADPATVDAAKVAVLTASVLAAVSAAVLLRVVARRHAAGR